MRGTPFVLIVLVLGASAGMVTASGLAGVWGSPPPQVDDASGQLNDSASDLRPSSGPVEGPVSSSESDVVGLIVSGLGAITNMAGAVALLPLTLIQLGFPAWAGVPIGLLAQTVVGVSIIEFATNREWT